MKSNSKIKETAEKTASELLEELHEIVAKAESMLKEAASESGGGMVESLRESCACSQARLGELYTQAKKECVDGAKSVDASVRSNPYQTLAIAAGVAFAIGMLMRRGVSKS